MLAPWKKSYGQPRQHIKKQRHHFANTGPSSQGYGFSNGHVWMWEMDCEESCCCQVASVVFDSVKPHTWQPIRLPPSLGFSRQEHWSGLPFPSPMHECEKWKWSRSVIFRLLATPRAEAHQAPPSMGFSRQEYWSGVPLPSPMKKAEHWRIDAFEVWCWKRLSKGNQSWVFFGRNDAKAETPVLWLPHAKSWLIRKDSDGCRVWRQEEKGMTEAEMAGWHHRLDGCEFEWTLGVGDGQGGLACCDSWGHKESDTTGRLNRTELNWW